MLAIPTESSYALAADPRNRRAVAAVFALKGRGEGKPLPVAVASMADLETLGVQAPPEALKTLEGLWPSPLTAVLPVAEAVPAAAGGSTLAVRVPEHPELCLLLEKLGPLTVTSANRSGETPALTADGAEHLLIGQDAVLLDAGTLPGGLPSTLVLWRGEGRGQIGPWDLLRQGAFDAELLVSRGSSGNQRRSSAVSPEERVSPAKTRLSAKISEG